MATQSELVEQLRSEVSDLEDRLATALAEAGRASRFAVDAPGRISTLETRVAELKNELTRAVAQNQKLSMTLREARDRIEMLRAEVIKLSSPPASFATLVDVLDDGTADIMASGRKMRVSVSPSIAVAELLVGELGSGRDERRQNQRNCLDAKIFR